jgi:hypothetical protein
LTESIAPKSDQLNADDLISGPVTVTIREVAKGSAEQPVDVHLVEFPGRAYRPSKSMRRVMVMAWGAEASAYAGRRLTLYRNPEITFGREKVGGIEIAELSHIDKPLTVALTATRGKRKSFTVRPLATPVTRDYLKEAQSASGNVEQIKAFYRNAQAAGAHQDILDKIKALATPAPQTDETPAAT